MHLFNYKESYNSKKVAEQIIQKKTSFVGSQIFNAA